ncbi:response regulator transcription factor [Culicoidibacter larvae]|uniref:Response regulator transcription factor n=1 Tax=Culicoidibacter larvae TaxID=2579976 RepID=A0A5R8QHC5_9FIRM|nr:response regulator transcription factor [Culicoidibacter larvae]TLG77408.1 response regulator transcription factor [Culicoidibacter larvae]
MFKILIIEDEPTIAEILAENIDRWGFEAHVIKDFHNILGEFAEVNPQLVLLDIQLPSFDGFYWCQKIREVSNVPIIFISSRTTNMDIVMAMNMGGDDYITKPFELDVVIAKIQAILRRTYSYQETNTDVITYNDILLNIKDSTVHHNELQCELTKNEFKILYILIKKHGEIISRDHLMRELWNTDSFIDDNTLTVNINRLRKKLSQIHLDDLIETKKSLGYIIK